MSTATYTRKTVVSMIAIGAVLITAAVYSGLNLLGTAAATDTRQSAANAAAAKPGGGAASKVVALVDGTEITETELTPFLNAGLDKAIAVDRAINKVIAANSAERMYRQISRSAVQSVRNDVLANVFVSQRSDEMRSAVTDADIKSFYQDRVKAEDFTAFRLRFFVSVDGKEAQDMFEAIGRGDKDAMAKLTFVRRDGDHYMSAADVPYGLGMAVKKLKAGERLQPVTVREGVLVLYVDDVKVNPKPELEKVQVEIRDLIVAERFNADMKARRAASKIELRG
jgi:peptidyl-prolyl cis-trans isomerase C